MGFAFVEFTQHTHAVQCLTKLNNNPNIFTDDKVLFLEFVNTFTFLFQRPIVEFSLENRVALNKKALRYANENKPKSSDGVQRHTVTHTGAHAELATSDVQNTKALIQRFWSEKCLKWCVKQVGK